MFLLFIVHLRRHTMSDLKNLRESNISPSPHGHAHPNGRRCCGRLISEKCRPEEEAAKTDQATGEKSCCKGHHNH